jgi:acetyl-CoA carboxylase carboxyl transferase subunit beta
VISPEGCAAILWRDEDAAPRAAAALRLDAASLLRAGVVDGVVPEAMTAGGRPDREAMIRAVGDAIAAELAELAGIPGPELAGRRLAGLLEHDAVALPFPQADALVAAAPEPKGAASR